jgi:hypothetical protein
MLKRNVFVPKGGDLTLEYTEEFMLKVRTQFELEKDAEVSDDQIRMFLFGACKTALDKAEEEIKEREELDNKTS